jgi:hypothetical protein
MWKTWLTGLAGLGVMACAGVAASEPERRPADRQPSGSRIWDRTLTAGTLIEATICNTPGGPLTATVTADVRNGGRWVVIPAQSAVGLRIASAGPGAGKRRIALDVTSVTVAGQVYPLSATIELAPGREAVVVAPGTRILFVLPDGLTLARQRAGSDSVVASSLDAPPIARPARSC